MITLLIKKYAHVPIFGKKRFLAIYSERNNYSRYIVYLRLQFNVFKALGRGPLELRWFIPRCYTSNKFQKQRN